MVRDKAVGRGVDHDAAVRGRGIGLIVVAMVAWLTIAVCFGLALRNRCMTGRVEAGVTEEVDFVSSSKPRDKKDLDIIWAHTQRGLAWD